MDFVYLTMETDRTTSECGNWPFDDNGITYGVRGVRIITGEELQIYYAPDIQGAIEIATVRCVESGLIPINAVYINLN